MVSTMQWSTDPGHPFKARMLALERCLMTKQRRSFTPEFKREAAGLVLDQGYSPIEAARSLGLVESVLRR